MNYEVLVEALRCCSKHERRCLECEFLHNGYCSLQLDAASVIEGLQKMLKAVQTNSGINFRMWEEAQAEVERLQAQLPKRGEWITIRLNNGGSYTGCSCCEAPIPTDTMLDYIPESESKYCYSCGAKMEVQDADTK